MQITLLQLFREEFIKGITYVAYINNRDYELFKKRATDEHILTFDYTK